MTLARSIKVLVITAALVVATAPAARAQGFEMGTSLSSLMIAFNGGSTVATFGVPSGGMGIINPGLYATVFTTSNLAFEPQVGLVVVSGGGETTHFLNLGAQFDYFFNGHSKSSPFLFAGAGLISIKGADTTPISLGGGLGYRVFLGDRLTMRFDARYTHYTKEGGNSVSFTVSLGGVFGKK